MLTAGVQPPQDPGESKGETVLAKRFRERGGKNVADKKIEARKRLIFLGLHRKPIKSQTRDLLCSRRPQAPSWSPEAVKTQSVFPFRS